jgi:pilus assembly protein CpaB
MKIAVVSLVVLGMLAAGAAAFVVQTWRLDQGRMLPEGQTAQVLVARMDLAAMTVITEDLVAVEPVSRRALPKGCLVSPVQAIGKSLRVEVLKGQVVTESSLAAPGRPADCIPRIPTGMRIITIPVSSRSISGGFLYPGCIVDVMTTYQSRSSAGGEAVSKTLLQRTKVWGVDDRTIVSIQAQDAEDTTGSSQSSSSGTQRVSLLLDTRQAELLQAAATRGVITLAIRNPYDDTIYEPEEEIVPDQNEPPLPEPDKHAVEEAVIPPKPPMQVEIIRGVESTSKTFQERPSESKESNEYPSNP